MLLRSENPANSSSACLELAGYVEWINKIRKEDYHQLQPWALARAMRVGNSGYSKQRLVMVWRRSMMTDDEKDWRSELVMQREIWSAPTTTAPPGKKASIARCGCRQSATKTTPWNEAGRQAGRQDRILLPWIGARPHACFTATSTDRDRPNSMQLKTFPLRTTCMQARFVWIATLASRRGCRWSS